MMHVCLLADYNYSYSFLPSSLTIASPYHFHHGYPSGSTRTPRGPCCGGSYLISIIDRIKIDDQHQHYDSPRYQLNSTSIHIHPSIHLPTSIHSSTSIHPSTHIHPCIHSPTVAQIPLSIPIDLADVVSTVLFFVLLLLWDWFLVESLHG